MTDSDFEYAKEGIELWLNNKPIDAEEHFKTNTDNIHVLYGHTLITCLNSVISYEMDKIEDATIMLRTLEKRCAGDIGWLKSVRTKFFGSTEKPKSLIKILEEQVILADTQLCLAILTFLTQDFSGLMKGSWLLRKAWKVYQNTYTQIYELYQESLNDENLSVNNYNSNIPNSSSTLHLLSPSSCEWLKTIQSPYECEEIELIQKSTSSFEITQKKNNNLETIPTIHNFGQSSNNIVGRSKSSSGITNFLQQKKDEIFSISPRNQNKLSIFRAKPLLDNQLTSTTIFDETNENYNPSKCNLNLDLRRNGYMGLESTSHILDDENPNKLKRLMGSVSFGYGAFQLCVSLLPPNLLKLISFFGFEGDRNIGISCLKYARATDDLRSPLATLSLLWYFLIGNQLLAFGGSDVNDDLSEASDILNESQEKYSNSALFLFFKGRIERLKSNLTEAIKSYECAYRTSAQREIKLLCLFEIGWCRLIKLDYGRAMIHFHDLGQNSKFSKSFYTYLTTICQGSFGTFDNLVNLRIDIISIISRSSQKEAQIEKFIARRVDKLPISDSEDKKFHQIYWKYLTYEMLYMWNAIGSCKEDELDKMISDCQELIPNEPMSGLSRLILGCCEAYKQNFSAAIQAYTDCIQLRKKENYQEDLHISAFAHYELAMLLLRHKSQSHQEAKELLLQAQSFKNYDFENRLGVRIHQALKQMN